MFVIRSSLMPRYLVNTYYDVAYTVLNTESKTDAAWILPRLRVWQKKKKKGITEGQHRGSTDAHTDTQPPVSHYNWAGRERVLLSQLHSGSCSAFPDISIQNHPAWFLRPNLIYPEALLSIPFSVTSLPSWTLSFFLFPTNG